ncbi:MAG: substrate-binding domain-containing protein [Xanthobacteraceae bacterium]|nr:substrate-binding domain-containing protein [Xanthobacteraceae bacterium]
MKVTAHVMATLLACVAGSGISTAAELIILPSQGNAPGVAELAAGFARASGHKVTIVNEAGAALEQRLANGPADLIMGGPEAIEGLTKKGRVIAGSGTPYMLAGLGVSVRAGAPKPDIATVEAYTRTLLAAKSIGYSSGCSGQHVADGIAQLGLTEKLKPKVTVTTGGKGPVTLYLARGDFELGIQQVNIMVGAPGTDFVGPVPAGIDKPCPNSVAIATVSKEPDAARAMIRFMTSPAAAPLLRKANEIPARS